MRDTLYTKSLARAALPSASIATNTTTNGTTVDLGVFGNDFRTVLFVVHTATITDGSFAFSLEESDDATAWTAVPSDRVQGSLPTVVAVNDNVVFTFGYIPAGGQYVRCVVVSTSVTSGGVMGAVAVCSGAGSSPVARS